MCICLNCQHLSYCDIYVLIEKKHKNNSLSDKISFYAHSPIIRINIISMFNKSSMEWDVVDCNSFNEQPGNWISENFDDLVFKKHEYW